MRKIQKEIKRTIKSFPWIVLSCTVVGGGVIFAYEAIGMGLYIINLLHAEKLP